MLKGKVALITGSTSGIGLAIAKELAAHGADILLNGFGQAADIDVLCSGIRNEFGVRVIYHGADLSRPEQIEKMINAADKLGGIDILINNAGIQHVAPIDEFPPEAWDAIIQLNLTASFHTIRHSLPNMKRNGWGRIINIASAHAVVASPYKSAYIAAKHGLAGLTKTVALEVAEKNITVNAICPGYVETPLVKNQIADQAKASGLTENDVVKKIILAAQPTRKFTTVKQVAGLAIFLCSSSADNITGSLQMIDGGWTAI